MNSLELIVLDYPWLFVGWMIAVGAAVGSFLNVVVYRLPAGLNIAYPASRCPACLHPIQGFDNIPVVSWFLLKGKCRHCGKRISARYPTVEALVAVIFGILTLAVVKSLPCDAENAGPVLLAVARLLYYALLPCCLLCLYLIDFDGSRPPKSLFVFALLAAAVPPLMWNELRVSISTAGGWLDSGSSIVAEIASGIIAGVMVGSAARAADLRNPRVIVWMTAIVGCYLGWQSVLLWSTIIFAVTQFGFARRSKKGTSFGAALLTFAFVDVVCRLMAANPFVATGLPAAAMPVVIWNSVVPCVSVAVPC